MNTKVKVSVRLNLKVDIVEDFGMHDNMNYVKSNCIDRVADRIRKAIPLTEPYITFDKDSIVVKEIKLILEP